MTVHGSLDDSYCEDLLWKFKDCDDTDLDIALCYLNDILDDIQGGEYVY